METGIIREIGECSGSARVCNRRKEEEAGRKEEGEKGGWVNWVDRWDVVVASSVCTVDVDCVPTQE